MALETERTDAGNGVSYVRCGDDLVCIACFDPPVPVREALGSGRTGVQEAWGTIEGPSHRNIHQARHSPELRKRTRVLAMVERPGS